MRKVSLIIALAVFCSVLVPFGISEVSAQVGVAAGGAEQPSDFTFVLNTVMFILIGIWTYYLLVVRPTTAKDEAHKKFIDGLKKSDEIVTTGGIFGRVVTIKPEFVTIEIAQNVRVKVRPENVRKTGGDSTPKVGVVDAKPATAKLQQTKR